MSSSYGSWEGADHVAELLWEALSGIEYMIDGPHSYDPDYKRELKEDGGWDAELERWAKEKKPNPLEALYMEGIRDGLWHALSETAVAANIMHKRCGVRMNWHRREHGRSIHWPDLHQTATSLANDAAKRIL
jgi:hypothetical protein